MKTLNNQKGQIMVAVMALSLLFITLYLSFQAYWTSRTRAMVSVREAYNMMDATDQAARDVGAAWNSAAASLPQGSSAASIQAAMLASPLVPNPACSTACVVSATNGCCLAGAVLCYLNPSNSNAPYCFYGTPTTTTGIDLRLLLPEEKTSVVEKYVVKVEDKVASIVGKFYDHDHGLFENEAMADSNSITPRTDTVGAQPVCGAPGNGATCTTCGTSAWSSAQAALPIPVPAPICGQIFACPQTFPNCQNYAGSLTLGTGGTSNPPPLFYQAFSLPVPGAPN